MEFHPDLSRMVVWIFLGFCGRIVSIRERGCLCSSGSSNYLDLLQDEDSQDNSGLFKTDVQCFHSLSRDPVLVVSKSSPKTVGDM